MTDEQIKSVALYFYFALPGEVLALEATDIALKKIKKEKKTEHFKEYPWACIVKICASVQLKLQKNLSRKKTENKHLPKKYLDLKKPWQLQSSTQLGPWKQYLIEKDLEALNLIIWVHILNKEVEQIARGMNITLGTLNYRLGEALQKLGLSLIPGSKQNQSINGKEDEK